MAFGGGVGHEQVNRSVVYMSQHGEIFFFSKHHQFFGHGLAGVGTVVQMEFANAAKLDSAGGHRGAPGMLGHHHLVNALITKPAVVVGAVAVQPNKRHHREVIAAARGIDQSLSAVVRPRISQHALDTVAFDARQHVSDRVRTGLAVPRLFVVVQVGVEQGAGVVSRLRPGRIRYTKHSDKPI